MRPASTRCWLWRFHSKCFVELYAATGSVTVPGEPPAVLIAVG